ncbi:MAG: hypothetical protein ABI760_22790 [Ferruginibacter sp.]
MKYFFYILVATCTSIGCNHANKEIKEYLINSDSVAINYYKGDGTMDTVVAVKIIRDRQKVDQLATFISERMVERNYKCGYDGSLHFFKMNKVIRDIDFGMNRDSCMYFYFLQYGKSQASALSEAAKELITSIRK